MAVNSTVASHAVALDNRVRSVSPTAVATRSRAATLPRATRTALSPAGIVGTAVLECSPLSLKQQIYEFAQRVKAAGIRQVQLVPVFLMAGVHVVDDIPAEVSAAQQLLGGDVELLLCDHLGSRPELINLLEDRLASLPQAGQLMVAHGSRRRHGNRGVENVARQLGVDIAYWAVPPDLESQTIALMQQGAQTLTILPYFLFSGGITDAIAHRTEELAERFPKVNFRLLPPLGASAALADIVVKLVKAS
ncbi:MAG: CbiX/SirB N-terminal domain-containing protein [Cyanobacteria bacterium J06632_22]